MRRVYCDCCSRQILKTEQIYSMEIKKGQDEEIILEDMCVDCYEQVKHIVYNAQKSWKMNR